MAICDEDLLKKENITIESSIKEFNENIQKTIYLKNNIEKQINEIDNSYDKVYKELTKSFELKHEKLTKEENSLKEKLQNEVTKIKEKLENYLTECNTLVKNSEKINKGIKNIEKEEEKNMIKLLSYISKINKNQKEMKKLCQEFMKSLKISFQEEETNIKYEEYYFNGFQTPKDIEIKDVSTNNFLLLWKIDDIKNIKNFDNKLYKVRVEIRKENEKFNQVYEGNENNCLIDNLNSNTNYEIRMCSVYNDLISPWSQIHKVKTLIFDSIILLESKNENKFVKQLNDWIKYKKLELIYRGTRDGSTAKSFHNKCDNQGPTLCLYKNDKENIFGG